MMMKTLQKKFLPFLFLQMILLQTVCAQSAKATEPEPDLLGDFLQSTTATGGEAKLDTASDFEKDGKNWKLTKEQRLTYQFGLTGMRLAVTDRVKCESTCKDRRNGRKRLYKVFGLNYTCDLHQPCVRRMVLSTDFSEDQIRCVEDITPADQLIFDQSEIEKFRLIINDDVLEGLQIVKITFTDDCTINTFYKVDEIDGMVTEKEKMVAQQKKGTPGIREAYSKNYFTTNSCYVLVKKNNFDNFKRGLFTYRDKQTKNINQLVTGTVTPARDKKDETAQVTPNP